MKYFLNFTGFRIQDADSRQQGSSLIYPQLRHCATACADVPRHLMRGAPTQAEPVVPQGQTSKCRLQRLDIMYSSSGCTSCSSFSTDSVSGFQCPKALSEEEGLSTTNEVSEVTLRLCYCWHTLF